MIINENSTQERLENDLLKYLVDIEGETHVRHFLCSSIFPVNKNGKNSFFITQS